MEETSSGGSSSSSPIKTVVVLVQENRSFDHMLGWFKELNPEIDGVSESETRSNPISTSDPNSAQVFFGKESQNIDPDPGHSFQVHLRFIRFNRTEYRNMYTLLNRSGERKFLLNHWFG